MSIVLFLVEDVHYFKGSQSCVMLKRLICVRVKATKIPHTFVWSQDPTRAWRPFSLQNPEAFFISHT